MTSPVWQATVTDDTGDVLPGAQIDVVIESTGTDATLFSNRAGTTSLSNPFFADSEGFAQFYTDPGAYRITATASGGGTTRTWRYVSLFDFDANVGTAAGEVPLNSSLVPKSGGTFTGNITVPGISSTAMPEVGGDPIVESGSNTDGEWMRWADGTQICTGRVPSGAATGTVTYAIAFSGKPKNPGGVNSNANTVTDYWGIFTDSTELLFNFRWANRTDAAANFIAIGSW